jgi:crotonobetainyl-CoA:carnitine CoA-transferase CaiB-like acyl-CoA transferase
MPATVEPMNREIPMPQPRTGPLEGLKVLDMSRVLAGPWSGQLLADFGADVVKVEKPGVGDDTRGWGPPFLRDAGGSETSDAAYYMSANRAKRSITIDISSTDGQALVKRLAKCADILIENYKVGGLAKYGLDYEAMKAVNPRLIYCSITGFGQTGPYAKRAGYDLIAQGAGGIMSITGERDDRPGGGPQKVGVAVADLMTGMYATTAILAAVASRERTGEGQQIDVALLDTQVAWLANQAMNYLVGGTAPKRAGNEHQNIVPYGVFPTRDGHFILGIGNNGQFRKFCDAAGRSEIPDDPRFVTNTDRVKNRDVLIPLLNDITAGRTMDDWITTLEPLGVPCGPINTLDRVFDHPQIDARGMRVSVPHSLGVDVDYPGNPIKFSGTPVDYPRAAPLLGEDTDAVLRDWLDLDEGGIAALRDGGVV